MFASKVSPIRKHQLRCRHKKKNRVPEQNISLSSVRVKAWAVYRLTPWIYWDKRGMYLVFFFPLGFWKKVGKKHTKLLNKNISSKSLCIRWLFGMTNPCESLLSDAFQFACSTPLVGGYSSKPKPPCLNPMTRWATSEHRLGFLSKNSPLKPLVKSWWNHPCPVNHMKFSWKYPLVIIHFKVRFSILNRLHFWGIPHRNPSNHHPLGESFSNPKGSAPRDFLMVKTSLLRCFMHSNILYPS